MNFQFPTGFSQVLTGLTIGAEFWDFQFPTGFSLDILSFVTVPSAIFFQFPTGFSRRAGDRYQARRDTELSIPYRILTRQMAL